VPGHDRHRRVDHRLADRPGDVGAGDHDGAAFAELDRLLARQGRERDLVVERDPPPLGEPRQGAVHRARVEVADTEPHRESARD
jgi:hypothetical protein